MEGFTYNNIFQTKGIEYIIIIVFLLLFIPFWIIVNKQKGITELIQKSVGILNAAVLRIPKGIFYSKNHTWAFLEKSGLAEVGIDDWLLHLTGNAKLKQLKIAGDMVKKGELITEIINNGKVLRMYSPISGKIQEINPLAYDSLQLISDEPYTDGWLYKLEPTNWKADTKLFYFGNEAKNWLNQELTRFKDFVSISLSENTPLASMVVLQEGGELLDHALSELPKAVWNDFQKEFLDT
ncbi:MAG: glycine cleavage system protein H [Salinivirgaceae bacterium]|nr:glycine cleavage system protein H [Salinivirgaceae bacterium]